MRTALVIDDSKTARRIVATVLGGIGFHILEAADGRIGLEELRRAARVDLAVVDWNMPVLDGLGFVQAVRAERTYDDVKLIMVTTEAEKAKVVAALGAGANEYLMKPFTREMLEDKLALLGLGP